MPAPKYLGKLDTNRPRTEAGRHIDTWSFRNGLPGGKPLEVKIHLVTEKDGSIAFTASNENLKTRRNKDINALRDEINAALRLFSEDHSGIQWEDWLEVIVEGRPSLSRYDEGKSMALNITYRPIPRGVMPDGRVVTVHRGNQIVVDFPKPHSSKETVDPEEFVLGDRHDGAEVSYIKASPENLKALEDLQGRLNQLRNSLSLLLSQDQVEHQLAKLAARPLQLTD